MYQSNRGSYRTQESLASMFFHSCLGKLVILGVVLAVLAFVAFLSRPSEQAMREEMTDNIRQCIETRDSINIDWIDAAVANIGYIFTEAGPNVDKELLANFNKHNHMFFYDRTFYTSLHIINNFHPEGIRAGIGVFGVVIPMVNFNDLLLREGPVRKDYNQPILQNTGEEEDFGSTPDLIFREDNYGDSY